MSTNFFTGYAPEKPTSKVMNPPGGRSNNIFGGYEEEKKQPAGTPSNGTAAAAAPQQHATSPSKQDMSAQQQAAANKNNNLHGSNIFGGDSGENTRTNKPRDNSQANLFGASKPAQNENQPAQAKSKKRTGYNPITGQAYEEEDEERIKHVQQYQLNHPANGTNGAANGTNGTTNGSNGTPTAAAPAAGEAQNNVHTSSRVSQPPGGRSTKLW